MGTSLSFYKNYYTGNLVLPRLLIPQDLLRDVALSVHHDDPAILRRFRTDEIAAR